jgi:hypothetical protein
LLTIAAILALLLTSSPFLSGSSQGAVILNLVIRDVTSSSVLLEWSESPDWAFDRYKVWRTEKDPAFEQWTFMWTTQDKANRLWMDTTVVQGKTYWYAVEDCDAFGCVRSNIVKATIPNAGQPPADTKNPSPGFASIFIIGALLALLVLVFGSIFLRRITRRSTLFAFGMSFGIFLAFLSLTILTTSFRVTMEADAAATNPFYAIPVVGPALGWTGALGPSSYTPALVATIGFQGLAELIFLGMVVTIFFILFVIGMAMFLIPVLQSQQRAFMLLSVSLIVSFLLTYFAAVVLFPVPVS